MSLALSRDGQKREWQTKGFTKSKLPPPQFRIGNRAILRLKKKYGYVNDDLKEYRNKEVIVEFIDDEEPRYAVRPVTGNMPAMYFHSDELWEVNTHHE